MVTVRNEVLSESPGLSDCKPIPFDQLPFSALDATAGSEDELQAVVVGRSTDCDLPLSIRESRFFRNIARRSASGEAPRRTLLELEAFLNDTRGVWENSWIRFPEARLSRHALHVFHADLQVARNGSIGERSDALRFRFTQHGEPWLRIPISYALKLSLADLIGAQPHLPEAMRQEASRLMRHFLNDNTSPETTSFHIVAADSKRSLGEQVAREAARRFLFTSLLISWANRRFGLLETGQRALVYHAPVPSVHQEELSSCTSDSFYRELFMSPCLSGWTDGEEKYQYMHLCHQVLSRSQLNAVAKLREAGIIANDLIVLPSLSNVSLANNGIHISIGSRALESPTAMSRRISARGREAPGRSGHQNLRALPGAVCRNLHRSPLPHRLHPVSSRAPAVVPAARARFHPSAPAVARVEGEGAAQPVRPCADAVWPARLRSHGCETV